MKQTVKLLILLLGVVLPVLQATVSARNSRGRALIVVDVQGCFLPGGALPTYPTNGTLSLIRHINTLRTAGGFGTVVFTQDWHPKGHISFADTHYMKPLAQVELNYTADGRLCELHTVRIGAGAVMCRSTSNNSHDVQRQQVAPGNQLPEVKHTLQQVLWPEHCVQHTQEAQLHPGLIIQFSDLLLRKGYQLQLDSYSAFEDSARVQSTGLADALRKRGVTSVVIAGLALEYCVLNSAIDAQQAGFDTTVVLDATAPVSRAGAADAIQELQQAGVHVVRQVWDAVHDALLPAMQTATANKAAI